MCSPMFTAHLQKAYSVTGQRCLWINILQTKCASNTTFMADWQFHALQDSVLLDLPHEVWKVPSPGRINLLSHYRPM